MLLPSTQSLPQPTSRQYEAPAAVVVSLDADASRVWTARLRQAGRGHLSTLAWGDSRAYQLLLARPGTLALLDCPDHLPSSELAPYVRALSILAPVAVVAPSGTVPRELLDAGALDVLPRQAPAAELHARTMADLRWLRRNGWVRKDERTRPDDPDDVLRRGRVGSKKSQALLLRILTASARRLCCHDIQLLLGEPGKPMSAPALRGRLCRLEPLLSALGYTLVRSRQWGHETLQVRPKAP